MKNFALLDISILIRTYIEYYKDINILEHRVGSKFFQHIGIGHTKNSVDDVNQSIGSSDICSDHCCVHATTFDGHYLVSAWFLSHIEVQLLPVCCCGNL